MNITEAYNRAVQQCTPHVFEYAGVLDAFHGIDSLNTSFVESLSIRYGYSGQIPELSDFPRLKEFRCTPVLSLDYVMRQDFSSIERLSLIVENSPGIIRLKAPLLQELHLYINDNETDQIDMFQMGYKAIDLNMMANLRELELRHCTGYDIIIDHQLNNLEKAVFANCRYSDFSHLREMPNLTRLTIVDSRIVDISFVQCCPLIQYIDLSYNNISDASILLTLPKLQRANLYRNPLRDADHLAQNLKSSIISKRDHDINDYLCELSRYANIAYRTVKNARKHKTEYPPFLQQRISTSTDEELFLYYLESTVWDDIKKAINGERGLLSRSLKPEDMLIQAVQEYPFIGNSLIQRYSAAMEKNKQGPVL